VAGNTKFSINNVAAKFFCKKNYIISIHVCKLASNYLRIIFIRKFVSISCEKIVSQNLQIFSYKLYFVWKVKWIFCQKIF